MSALDATTDSTIAVCVTVIESERFKLISRFKDQY